MSSSQGNPPSQNGQAQNGQGGDPSMEDILASIRRILSEDGASGHPGAAATLPPALAQPQRNVLALDSSMLVREPQATQPIAAGTPLAGLNTIVSPGMDATMVAPPIPAPVASAPVAPAPVASAPVAPLPEPPPQAPVHVATVQPSPIAPSAPMVSPMSVPASETNGLVAPSAMAAASASVSELMRTLAAERQQASQPATPPAPPPLSIYRGGPSLEDLVREEMRPILKAWLDANLPPVVERLVRAEIERVVSRSVG
jgi:cell pole-organizing protein PopZ